jgi:O-antigen/teichoic acid export membrane protein
LAALRVNILANYIGQIWLAAMGLAFLPVYIRLLGMEAFGLVGLMISFQSILQLFDLGIGSATNRELSRRAHNIALADSARDLVRSAEILIWLLATAAMVMFWFASHFIADHWLHLQTLPPDNVASAVATMGVAIGLLWPSTFYAHCLSGLEKQPALNGINVAFGTLRFAGVVPVMIHVGASIEVFLWWHVVAGITQSFATALVVWKLLPKGSRRPRVSLAELKGARHFAGGLFVVSLLALGITQMDRLILASLRPLEELGYYTLALSVAAGMGRMVHPMFNALYPRFSRLVAVGDNTSLKSLYHVSSQLLAVVIAALAAIFVVFADEVLLVWTGDAGLAATAASPMAILVGGTAINGLMNVPYALQLAHGWTRLTVQMNSIAITLGIPLCCWGVSQHGSTGAAMPWMAINIGFFLVGIPFIHRRLLRGELVRWYLRDIAPPFLASFSTALGLSALLLLPEDRTQLALQLGSIMVAVLTASILSSTDARRMILALPSLRKPSAER